MGIEKEFESSTNNVRESFMKKWSRTRSPLGVVTAAIGASVTAALAYHQYDNWWSAKCGSEESHEKFAGDIRLEGGDSKNKWKVTCYRLVPLRAFSRVWGWANNRNLPVWAREPVYRRYAKAFGCNIEEADKDELSQYKSLGEFFRRGIKSGVRPICVTSPVVSPADGTIQMCGRVENERVEQVKGVSYSLPAFLGPQTWTTNGDKSSSAKKESSTNNQYTSQLLKNKNNSLFHCVIYLAPGDCHRFHSPVTWRVHFRRHFSGELLSVNPKIFRWIPGLFSLNERVVYVGEWEHGFFSYTAIGATTVGSIKVYEDPDLVTNRFYLKKPTSSNPVDKVFTNPVQFQKGDKFGEFNLGSTIVLLFEAPSDFDFKGGVQSACKIRVGEWLFRHNNRSHIATRCTASRSLRVT